MIDQFTRAESLECKNDVNAETSLPSSSRVSVHMQRGRYDEVLLVSTVTVRWVVCVLATAQPNRAVFLWDKAQREQAWGFGFVGSVAERLKDKRDQRILGKGKKID